jgi:antirestriction protein ArdC
LGAQVRKGERSTIVVFCGFFDSTTEEEEQQEDASDHHGRPRCFACAYHVFNAAQVDGYEKKPENLLPESERIAQVDAFFNALPATIQHGGDGAYYSPAGDYIQFKCRRSRNSSLPKNTPARSCMSLPTGRAQNPD